MCRIIKTLIGKRTFLNGRRDLFFQILYNSNVGQVNNAIFCCHTSVDPRNDKEEFSLLIVGESQPVVYINLSHSWMQTAKLNNNNAAKLMYV